MHSSNFVNYRALCSAEKAEQISGMGVAIFGGGDVFEAPVVGEGVQRSILLLPQRRSQLIVQEWRGE